MSPDKAPARNEGFPPGTALRRRAALLIIIPGLLLAAAAALSAGLLRNAPPENGVSFVKAVRGDVTRFYRQSGELQAAKVRQVFNRVTGVITWMIPEGTLVRKGDVIVKLDDTDMRQALEDFMEQTFLPHQKSVESDRAAYESTRKELDIAVRLAELDLRSALLAKKKLLSDHHWELELAELDLRSARLREQKARIAYENSRSLAARKLVAQTVLKADHVAWLNAAARLEEIRNRLNRLRKGPDPIKLRKIENDIKTARENLEAAKFDRDTRVELKRLEVVDAEARFNRALIDRKRLERNIAFCDVKAPFPGIVVYINVWKGSTELSPIHIGETRRRGQDLLKIADVSRLRVRLVVPEADIGPIRKGLPARVRFAAFPERTFPAEVAGVSPTASDKNQLLGTLALAKSGQAMIRAFEVFLALKEKDERLRLGLTAEAEIEVASSRNTIVIPLAAVAHSGGRPFVWTRENGRLTPRRITLGLVNESEAEVLHGLSEGEEVAVPPPASSPRAILLRPPTASEHGGGQERK